MSGPSDSAIEERLFQDFVPSTYEEWKEAAVASLKGAPFEKKVFTKTYEDIDLKPIYMEADTEEASHMGSLPGFAPYARGTSADGYTIRAWGISQEISVGDPQNCNDILKSDLNRGLTDLNLKLDLPTRSGCDPDHEQAQKVGYRGLSLSTTDDVAAVLEDIDLRIVPIFIDAGPSALPLLSLFTACLDRKGQAPSILNGCLGADPLNELARTGRLPLNLDAAYDQMASVRLWTGENTPGLKTILVQGHPYHEAGASAVQELAFTLSAAVSYLKAMMDRGLTVDQAATGFQFAFSIGTHFFMEIAKLRAARILWAQIVDAFGGQSESGKMAIHARTSAWTKTTYDPYVNMLRNTTEAFSAVMGGVDSLHILPFDEAVRPPDEFSRRVSRNLQLLLKHECRFTHPIDPGGGAWFIENLTDQVARQTWQIFQEVESRGGLVKALEAGYPQQAARDMAQKRAANLAVRKDVMVGINSYVNLKEVKLEPDNTDYAALKTDRVKTVQAFRQTSSPGFTANATGADLVKAAVDAAGQGATLGDLAQGLFTGKSPAVEPLHIHRAADGFEQLRINAEKIEQKLGHPIQVFLANMGPVPQHKPRADFSTGFFEVGGFQVLGNNGFDTVDDAVNGAMDSGAPIVVICSTDKAYPEIVPDLTRKIKAARPDTTVILAGKPAAEYEASYREAGLDNAIFIRANCFDILNQLQKKIGGIDG